MTRLAGDGRGAAWCGDIIDRLRDRDVERVITGAWTEIEADAADVGVRPRTLAVQVRLHLPSLERGEFRDVAPGRVYQRVRIPSLLRAHVIRREEEEAQLRANSSLLIAPRKVRRDLSVELADGRAVRLYFSPVAARTGHFIQGRLHYLQSPRADTHREYGLYLPGAEHPITYVAFSPCDREYIADCLRGHLDEPRLGTLVLTRMHTLPDAPPNLISLTLRHAIRAIRDEGRYRALVTAFNPFLGFTGAAFRASGFRLVAGAPVTYSYRKGGQYATRRQGGKPSSQRLDTPYNLLVAKGVTRDVQRSLLDCGTMFKVDLDRYQAPEDAGIGSSDEPVMDGDDLIALRRQLEKAWSDDTVHPSYLSEEHGGPPSRGQCGVSSVYLLKALRERGVNHALYCYGDVTFDDESKRTVKHHCWVEYGRPDDRDRYVLDLTSDQSEDLGTEVLSERIGRLAESGVNYLASVRLSLDEVLRDRVWPRVMKLEEQMARIRDEGVVPS